MSEHARERPLMGIYVSEDGSSGRPTEDGDGRLLAADLPRETGRQARGPALRAGERSSCGRRSEVATAVLQARPRFCPGSEGPGHSLIPHASARSSRVRVRPSPESDRMRWRASRSPASRRRRRFSARSASSSARGTKTMSSACAVIELLTTTRAVRYLSFTHHAPPDPSTDLRVLSSEVRSLAAARLRAATGSTLSSPSGSASLHAGPPHGPVIRADVGDRPCALDRGYRAHRAVAASLAD
jgi:hypothetical protein